MTYALLQEQLHQFILHMKETMLHVNMCWSLAVKSLQGKSSLQTISIINNNKYHLTKRVIIIFKIKFRSIEIFCKTYNKIEKNIMAGIQRRFNLKEFVLSWYHNFYEILSTIGRYSTKEIYVSYERNKVIVIMQICLNIYRLFSSGQMFLRVQKTA